MTYPFCHREERSLTWRSPCRSSIRCTHEIATLRYVLSGRGNHVHVRNESRLTSAEDRKYAPSTRLGFCRSADMQNAGL